MIFSQSTTYLRRIESMFQMFIQFFGYKFTKRMEKLPIYTIPNSTLMMASYYVCSLRTFISPRSGESIQVHYVYIGYWACSKIQNSHLLDISCIACSCEAIVTHMILTTSTQLPKCRWVYCHSNSFAGFIKEISCINFDQVTALNFADTKEHWHTLVSWLKILNNVGPPFTISFAYQEGT